MEEIYDKEYMVKRVPEAETDTEDAAEETQETTETSE